MAAYAALVSLMHLIDDIQNHHSPPISLDQQQVQSLIEKVTFLQEFLEGYISPFGDVDEEADPLEIRIVNAAYATEDVIEFHIVNLIKLGRSTTPSFDDGEEDDSEEGKEVSCINLYEDIHQLIEEMDLIKKVAVKADVHHHRRQRKVFAPSDDSLASSSSTGHNTSTPIVCSNDVLLEIMDQLVAGRPSLQIIPVVGMGGIGKTTLARNLYAQPLIMEYFDICIWATISQQYNTREILCELLSLKNDQSDDEIGLELYKYLFGRRFLVVMDDMWSVDAWDEMQRFFPNNDNGSRIMVTTRLFQLRYQLSNSYGLHMKFLDQVSSWSLFSQIVFGEESCPLDLVEIGKEIVENCRGLPLSIVVVGGLLKKMEHTRGCWESIRNNVTSLVNLENDKHCLRLLKMSYNHLPVYLKPCFLYMGVFEEDSKISVSRLINLWISEGFLKPMNGKSMRTIGKMFLEELLGRNLILVDWWSSVGNVRYCKIHDLVRDLSLRESKKYEFYHVIGGCGPPGMNSQRRVVITRDIQKNDAIYVSLQSMSNTRSVICEDWNFPLCQNFDSLRIVEARYNYFDQKYINAFLFQYVNLRHIVVILHSVASFPSSLNLVWNLHTLIVHCDHRCDAPAGILKMPQLRHIEFTGEHLYFRDPPSSNGGDEVVVMENLEILKGVWNFKCGEEVVKRIPNVNKLGVKCRGSNDYYCLSNIESLCKLESLYIWFFLEFRKVDVSRHKLNFPHSLKSLHLRVDSSGLEWEEMLEKIGSLPLLQKLKLESGCFGTGKWETVEGQFPSLKYLSLRVCRGLKQWTTPESSSIFPCLEHLHLSELLELEEIPREIGDIPTLQRIKLDWCSQSAVLSVKEIVEEQVELQGEQLPFHVKVLVFRKDEALLSLAGPNFDVKL